MPKIIVLNSEKNEKKPIKIVGCLQIDGESIAENKYNWEDTLNKKDVLKVVMTNKYNGFDCLLIDESGTIYTAIFNDGFM